jgi:hypothetical protein
MKYTAEMGSCAMIKTGPGTQKLMGGIHRYTDTQTGWISHSAYFYSPK